MDKNTRSAIERATQRARELLEEDFAAQLQGDFDVQRGGAVAEKPGPHLSARQVFQRDRVVAALEHKRATGLAAADAVADYLRDAAFTTLNRFVALKMLEARELVQECVTKGEQSAGYREFCGLAPGLALLPDSAGYRLYVESLFDELSTEVKELFDRHDPVSVLWPRRATFEALLEILNVGELSAVWGEDETIGWVYQFFNSAKDRHAARYDEHGKPKIPKNARELAVRNQFFTPRYIVQFLTDNTLGRIWYEMHGAKTAIADHCKQMVRRVCEDIEIRPKKDPRDIRVLDPACGSGHFLLYAFDVLLTMYEEAYEDPAPPRSKVSGKTLAEEYPTLEALRKAAPALILAHNLHGVDIDARCAQIAQLALWMRVQRTYRDLHIDRGERPAIRHSNIVIAEVLVTNEQITAEFVAQLADEALGRVFSDLVDALKLAADLGLLLRLEKLVARPAVRGQTGELFAPAEVGIRTTLTRFIAEGVNTSIQRRLFTGDALQGLGLLELAEKKFDVVLMNPPFGEPTGASNTLINGEHDLPRDLYCSFIARGIELAPNGRVGAITSSSFLLYTDYQPFRSFLLQRATPHILCDLGWGVLDANVATAAYVLDSARPPASSIFIDLARVADRETSLRGAVSAVIQGALELPVYEHACSEFAALSGAPFAYWFSREFLHWVARARKLKSVWREHGIGAGPHNFFFRLRWELPLDCEENADVWPALSNGGRFSPFFRDFYLHIDWRKDGRHIKAHLDRLYPYLKGNVGIKIQREHAYLQPGLTYGKRTSRFNAQVLPEGMIPSFEGIGAYPANESDVWWLLAYLNSRFVAFFLNLTCGQHKNAVYIDRVPLPEFNDAELAKLGAAARRLWELGIEANSVVETCTWFVQPAIMKSEARCLRERLADWRITDRDREVQAWCCIEQIERIVLDRLSLPAAILDALELDQGPPYWDAGWRERAAVGNNKAIMRPVVCRDDGLPETDLMLEMLKNGGSPAAAASHLNAIRFVSEIESRLRASQFVSWLVGCVLGRWTTDPGGGPPTKAFAREPWLPPRAAKDSSEAHSSARIHVLDERHPGDLVAAVTQVALSLTPQIGELDEELARELGMPLRRWLAEAFFAAHVEMYSKQHRRAPIYWQLAIPSASYSVWLYIHAFTGDTLFRVQNDYAGPKLAHEERRLESMRQEAGEAPKAAERRALAAQEAFVEELRAFLEEIKRVAPLWNPNLDDGVIINFAPLWRLVPHHKSWQRELKSTWDALCAGKYDWSHLAMHLWPKRVVPKCATDRSLAIAHGLEDVFWVEGADGKWVPRTRPTSTIDDLVRERTSPAVDAALKSLLEAPVAAANGGRGRGRHRRSATAT